ncbi:S8 family peptidase [Paractinoplanes atraurantiacus]|uniref:Peptidase inhibitor I9 n=1 Tax=Paractinoplanes atraurantiacus TaxID=1036182 RepID=A0A285ISN7_9ACTN|nr:S8 family peptidase [Actinoplanes atraurantiacus]SNY51008.1 Peptidase inhibitor I9 [Actinoplanes atraurantiacus]
MAKRRILIAGLFAAITAAATATPAAAAATGEIRLDGTATAVPGSYIVVLKAGAKTPATLAKSFGGQVRQSFGSINAYEAGMTAYQAKRLAASPDVAYVEQNQTVSLLATQANATWGLDRIDQRNRPLSTTYSYTTTGSGVTAYIIDTGIKYTHNDFGGRASYGYDAVGSGGVDCNGHGTHVAGTVGGTTYGVAKQVRLVGVRVLNCSGSGTTAGVIAGVNWVTTNAVKPAVANMSLGGGVSSTLDSAVSRSITSGVTYALAAGNSNANACNSSPSRVAAAITVGATTSTDARASYSNYGTCLDLFAPGSSITSDWYTSNTATNTISGTSMASPHVAGAAARVLSGSPGLTPAQVRDSLVNGATTGVVTSPGTGSPNRLLYLAP